MDSKVRYFHKHSGNTGGFTIAYRQHPNNSIEWNYARCNEQDNFSRKIGRDISVGRLVSNKVMNYYYTGTSQEFLGYLNSFSDQKLSSVFPQTYNWF